MNELALFAGAGGGILASHLLGWTTVCAVEIDTYARSVLLARQNDEMLPPFPIWDDVRTFDGRPWRGRIDVVSGGFPCQDISCAGKGAGITGEKSGLWVEMARIISEVRPRFVFVENSPMLLSRGLGRVLGDLAAMGFDARWGIISAENTGAPHQRKRIWIVANTNSIQFERGGGSGIMDTAQGEGQSGEKEWQRLWDAFGDCGEDVDDTDSKRCNKGQWREQPNVSEKDGGSDGSLCAEFSGASEKPKDLANPDSSRELQQKRREQEQRRWIGYRSWSWPTDTGILRVANGIPDRVERIRAIGNAQVSRVAATAWKILSGS